MNRKWGKERSKNERKTERIENMSRIKEQSKNYGGRFGDKNRWRGRGEYRVVAPLAGVVRSEWPTGGNTHPLTISDADD